LKLKQLNIENFEFFFAKQKVLKVKWEKSIKVQQKIFSFFKKLTKKTNREQFVKAKR
jgi:hypothetical protein